VLLVRATWWAIEHACSAVHAGIYHLRGGWQGRSTEDRASTDGKSEGGPHQRYKEKRRS